MNELSLTDLGSCDLLTLSSDFFQQENQDDKLLFVQLINDSLSSYQESLNVETIEKKDTKLSIIKDDDAIYLSPSKEPSTSLLEKLKRSTMNPQIYIEAPLAKPAVKSSVIVNNYSVTNTKSDLQTKVSDQFKEYEAKQDNNQLETQLLTTKLIQSNTCTDNEKTHSITASIKTDITRSTIQKPNNITTPVNTNVLTALYAPNMIHTEISEQVGDYSHLPLPTFQLMNQFNAAAINHADISLNENIINISPMVLNTDQTVLVTKPIIQQTSQANFQTDMITNAISELKIMQPPSAQNNQTKEKFNSEKANQQPNDVLNISNIKKEIPVLNLSQIRLDENHHSNSLPSLSAISKSMLTSEVNFEKQLICGVYDGINELLEGTQVQQPITQVDMTRTKTDEFRLPNDIDTKTDMTLHAEQAIDELILPAKSHFNIQHTKIQLRPNELGTLEIDLQLNNDNLQIKISSDKAEVLQLLEESIPELERTLENHHEFRQHEIILQHKLNDQPRQDLWSKRHIQKADEPGYINRSDKKSADKIVLQPNYIRGHIDYYA